MNKERSLNIQRNIILILVVLLVFVATSLTTLALYTRFEQDSTNITLANPVRIMIPKFEDGTSEKGTVLLPEGTVAYPGTKVTLNLGFDLEAPSSPAFIRARLKVTSDAFVDQGGATIEDGLITFGGVDENGNETNEGKPNPNEWVLVNFNFIDEDNDGIHDNPQTADYWHVYVQKLENTGDGEDTFNARSYLDSEPARIFITGTVKVSKSLTNEFANKKINFSYRVEAIQTANVQPPVSSTSSYYYYDYNNDGIAERIFIGSWGVEAQR